MPKVKISLPNTNQGEATFTFLDKGRIRHKKIIFSLIGPVLGIPAIRSFTDHAFSVDTLAKIHNQIEKQREEKTTKSFTVSVNFPPEDLNLLLNY